MGKLNARFDNKKNYGGGAGAMLQNALKKYTNNNMANKRPGSGGDVMSPAKMPRTATFAKPHNIVPQKFVRSRMPLPISAIRQKLIDVLKSQQTVIFIGETASGKTTQIPQYLYEAQLYGKKTIAITQPRRVAATQVAHRVAKEMKSEIGFLVGYSVRFDEKTSDRTVLKYMTDGMLLREAITDPLLEKYSVVILDEAHERSIQTDLLFGIVKRAQQTRKTLTGKTPLKLVIMSASMDVDHFSKYFSDAPVYYLAGRQFPIRMKYASEEQTDYVHSALVTTFQIHQNEEPGDILVFCTGQEEIDGMVSAATAAAKQLPDNKLKLLPVALYASLPHIEQIKALEPSIPGYRKVIFATNVAETSLTIPGVKFVVDTGKVKCRTFQPATGFESLKVENISKAQALQRAGRAGRESDGTCYRLFTEKFFLELREHTVPEILRCNLMSVVLQLVAYGITDVDQFEFLDKPGGDCIKQAIERLESFKSIEKEQSGNTYKLTTLGQEMVLFPLDPTLSRVLIASKELECTEEILTIISLLSAENIFYVPNHLREKANEVIKKFKSSEGDHIMLLNVYRAYNGAKGNLEWCKENFINKRSIETAKDIRQQLARIWDGARFAKSSCGTKTELIRRCLTKGYFGSVATLQRDGTYKTAFGKIEVHIHPSSCLFGAKPENVIYTELVHTTKSYMRNLSLIDNKWL